VLTPGGHAVGFESCWNRNNTGRIYADGYVHPEFFGQGIGTYLLRWAETRAQDHLASYPEDVLIRLLAGLYGNDQGSLDLFQAEGFQAIRHFWHMRINMTEAPAAPELPTDISIRTLVRDQDEHAVHEAMTESFRDHWGSVPTPFDEWAARRIEIAGFDPSLWFLAIDNATGQVAGAALCRFRDQAWVDTLGVRRPWRKHGLGMALLRHAFGEFYQRGSRQVGLGVDAQNPTGATRLYERAGMEISQRFVTYAKELRPGRDLSPDEPADR
jgi:mycothiol synthase